MLYTLHTSVMAITSRKSGWAQKRTTPADAANRFNTRMLKKKNDNTLSCSDFMPMPLGVTLNEGLCG